jgi:hypothetical protein
MLVFLAPWILFVVGLSVHVFIDHSPLRHTWPRIVELTLLWLLVFGGTTSMIAALGHLGPWSIDTAESIGYAPGMFQWEVAFADLALGVLSVFSVVFRDRWLTAAVVAGAVFYGGAALGHLQEMGGGNMNPGNVWSLPSDLALAILGVALLVLYRRGLGKLPRGPRYGVVGGD